MTRPYLLQRYVPESEPQDYIQLVQECETIRLTVGQRRLNKVLLTQDGVTLTQNEALQIGIHGLRYYRISKL